MRSPRREGGFTLLEVMIAAAVIAILALGLAATMGTAFLAAASARDTTASTNACQRLMEELHQLDYGDVIAHDGDAALAAGGIALKVSVTEAMVGVLLVEVCACRPREETTLAELSALTMVQFRNLPAAPGTPLRLITYRAER